MASHRAAGTKNVSARPLDPSAHPIRTLLTNKPTPATLRLKPPAGIVVVHERGPLLMNMSSVMNNVPACKFRATRLCRSS
jgi:hypothetical protein